jgi:hypothetical protein
LTFSPFLFSTFSIPSQSRYSLLWSRDVSFLFYFSLSFLRLFYFLCGAYSCPPPFSMFLFFFILLAWLVMISFIIFSLTNCLALYFCSPIFQVYKLGARERSLSNRKSESMAPLLEKALAIAAPHDERNVSEREEW